MSNQILETGKLSNTELGLAAVYCIQKLGQPTLSEVEETLERIGADVSDAFQLRDVLDSLKKRDFVAQNQKPGAGGFSRMYFSLKKIKYASMPEAAHIKDLLPKLLEEDRLPAFLGVPPTEYRHPSRSAWCST